jgi:hypothetical protein
MHWSTSVLRRASTVWRYRVNPKSLENAKISVAAAAGAERWGQVLGSRAWPHDPARLE